MTARLATVLMALVVLAPGSIRAQTNLDQGKSAVQIFAIGCSECHKSVHALANGRGSAALTDFLQEHYTTNRAQAAALAAYVLGGRGTESGTAGQGHGQKPAADHASASAEEPKQHQGRRRGQPQGGISAAKLQRSGSRATNSGDRAIPEEQPSIMAPTVQIERGRNERRSATVARSRRKEPKNPLPVEPPPAQPATQEPAAVIAPAALTDQAPTAAPPPEASPAPAVAPSDAAPSEKSTEDQPAPRDNIPD